MQHPMEAVHGDGVVVDKSEAEFDRDLAKSIIDKSNELKDESVDIALRVLAAEEALHWSVNHIRRVWVEWKDEAHNALEELRQLRFAFTAEGKQVLAEAKDIRNFFLDDKHIEEIGQLKEFVQIIERLHALEKNGTLDALVDVVLRLAEGQNNNEQKKGESQ